MADRRDIDFTYSLTDRVIRLSLGELAEFSGAKYDGDFSLSLEQAQRRKHEYVAEQIGIGPGRRVLDLGCGWGALLEFVRERGAIGVGVTLSGLHRDDPPVERADWDPQPQKDAAQAPASAALAHECRLPAGVHLGSERKPGLLRARDSRPLQTRVREADLTPRSDRAGSVGPRGVAAQRAE